MRYTICQIPCFELNDDLPEKKRFAGFFYISIGMSCMKGSGEGVPPGFSRGCGRQRSKMAN